MGVYLRAKFVVSSIILTGFRQGVILPPPPHTPQNEPLKSPHRLGLMKDPFRSEFYLEDASKGIRSNFFYLPM